MRNLLVILCCYATCCFGQPGFNKHFDFGGISTGVVNMIVDLDTIVAYGLSLSPPPLYQWGVVFAKLDTFGNVLTSKIVYDTAGGHFADIKNADIKVLNDNSGYVLIGSLYNRNAGFLMQFDREGNLTNYREYPDNAAITTWYRKIIEVDNGFLIFGSKAKLDYYTDAFVLKVDKAGNKIWEKSYETPGYEHMLYAAIQKEENTFVIGSTRVKKYPAIGGKARIWAIDTIGNLLWDWEASNFTDDGVAVGLNATADNGWIYYSGEYYWSPPDWLIKTKIVKRDANFNLKWERYVSPTAYTYTNYAIDLKPVGGNNYIALGTWSTAASNGNEPYQGGSLYKISDNGDSLWSRLDTALFDHYDYDLNEYSGVGVLSSGSIVAFGHAVQPAPGINGLYAWLVKVNVDGCLDTLLCATSGAWEAPGKTGSTEVASCQTSPNPARDLVTFSWRLPATDQARIEIYNANGMLLQTLPVSVASGQVPWHNSVPGLYFYRLVTTGVVVAAGKIVFN